MKKNIVNILVTFITIFVWQSVMAQETAYCSGSCESKTKCGHEGRFVVPSTIKYKNDNKTTYKVTEIGLSFRECNVKTVVIPNSVNLIRGSFEYCKELDSIILPNNLKKIEDSFFRCKKLSSIQIPGKVEELNYCFNQCGLKSVTIPKSVVTLNKCFDNCTNLKSVVFEGTINEIKSCFNERCGLKQITIPDGVEIIDDCFNDCYYLTSVTIPVSVIEIRRSFTGVFGPSRTLTVLNPIPPQVDGSFRGSFTQSCTLYVPKGSLNAYKTAEVWKNFTQIEELE